MGFFYTPDTIMRPLNYVGNEELCRSLLKHDWRMISNMYNYDFDLIKPYIASSLTFLSKVDLRSISDLDKLAEIIEFTYSKHKIFRRQLMEYILSFDHIKILDCKKIRDIVINILNDAPEYTLVIEDLALKRLFAKLGMDYSEFIQAQNFANIYKKLSKHKSKSSSRSNYKPYKIYGNRLFGCGLYWTPSHLVSEKNIDQKVESMLNDFPNKSDLHSILLLWKLS